MRFGRFKDKTVRRWWCQLNSWRWPENLPMPKPASNDYDDPLYKEAVMAVQMECAWRFCKSYWNGAWDKERNRQ